MGGHYTERWAPNGRPAPLIDYHITTAVIQYRKYIFQCCLSLALSLSHSHLI